MGFFKRLKNIEFKVELERLEKNKNNTMLRIDTYKHRAIYTNFCERSNFCEITLYELKYDDFGLSSHHVCVLAYGKTKKECKENLLKNVL